MPEPEILTGIPINRTCKITYNLFWMTILVEEYRSDTYQMFRLGLKDGQLREACHGQWKVPCQVTGPIYRIKPQQIPEAVMLLIRQELRNLAEALDRLPYR